jgi:DNA-binding transcriptional LysR family regulator
MDLAELRIFKAVAEQGGITKAAAALHRVQSNVTTRVKQLEERLGAKLFNRQGRRLVLSSEGKVLLAYADRLLRLSSEAQAAVKGHAPHGLLKIGSLESTAATRLPPVLARYHRAHPAVRLELVTGTSGALVSKVLREEVEAAFVAEPFSAKNLEMLHAFSEELVLITPKNHPRVRTPKDLGQRTILGFTTGCSYRRRLEGWLGRSSIVAERVMEYGSYHAIVACTAAGSGVAVVPKSVLRAVGAQDEVAVHPLPASVAIARTMLVWRRGHASSALDALREELGHKTR